MSNINVSVSDGKGITQAIQTKLMNEYNLEKDDKRFNNIATWNSVMDAVKEQNSAPVDGKHMYSGGDELIRKSDAEYDAKTKENFIVSPSENALKFTTEIWNKVLNIFGLSGSNNDDLSTKAVVDDSQVDSNTKVNAYLVSGDKIFVNGLNGEFDATNDDVAYGRNAVVNFEKYVDDIGNGTDVPLNFEYRYSPEGEYSNQALLGNAYQELGGRLEISLEELNEKMGEFNKELGTDYSGDALDLNGNGKVDIAEYATSNMAADMLDVDPEMLQISNLDGMITNVGESASHELHSKADVVACKNLFQQIYDNFGLAEALKSFKVD